MISQAEARAYHPAWYPLDTPRAIIDVFEDEYDASTHDDYFHRRKRYRLHYGNPLTGRSWEQSDTGYLDLTDQTPQTFILKAKPNSTSGNAVLLSNIVKIETVGPRGSVVRQCYRHPQFHTPEQVPPQVEETAPEGRAFRRVSLGRNSGEATSD